MASLRRAHERVSADLRVRLLVPDEEGRTARFQAGARLVDVSLGGCFVESTFFLRPREEVVVQIPLEGRVLSLPAEVVRVEDALGARTGMGLSFFDVELEDGDRERLVRLVVPPEHKRFYADLQRDLPELAEQISLQDVSLLVHLWEEWRSARRHVAVEPRTST